MRFGGVNLVRFDYNPEVQQDNPASELLRSRHPLIIGHRGYGSIAPENTLPSFAAALEAGPDLVEMDYHHSRDGVPLVIHDRTVRRTTDGLRVWRRRKLKVSSRAAIEFRALDAGSWYGPGFAGCRVPLLEEALEFVIRRGGVPLIEHKAGDAKTCAELLLRRRWVNKVVVISFDWSFLRDLHKRVGEQVSGALGPASRFVNGRRPRGLARRLREGWLDHVAGTGARIVVWNRQVSSKAIALAHERGLKVWIYTIDDPARAARLVDLGVDGIITNRIRLIRGALDGRHHGMTRARMKPS